MTPRETPAAKAARLLATGRVHLTHVDHTHARATVTGDTGTHHLRRKPDTDWTCTCQATTRCSHILAVDLVTRPR